MNKKANVLAISLVALVGLFFVVIVFAAYTPAFETIRDTMNSSFTTEHELRVSSHINNAWGLSFIVLAFSIVVWWFLAALSRQSKEYYR